MNAGDREAEGKGMPGGEFTTTHWSVVLAAGQAGSSDAAEALEKLCRTYWYALYAYVRRKGRDHEEAQDLTQEFLVRLLEKNYLAHADRDKGKFRSFLLAALNHFLANDWRRTQAAKRGGGQALISLDDPTVERRYSLEPASDLTPEKIYERRWALTLLDQALARLQEEMVASGKARQFDRLRDFLANEPEEKEYAAAAAELEIAARGVAVVVHRLRQRYRQLVREEVAHTVGSPAEVEDEIRWLIGAVG